MRANITDWVPESIDYDKIAAAAAIGYNYSDNKKKDRETTIAVTGMIIAGALIAIMILSYVWMKSKKPPIVVENKVDRS